MEAKYQSLKDKNVVVVGTGGIRGAIVKDFLEQGSRVFAFDKKEEVLKKLELYASHKDKNKKLSTYQIDVLDYEKYEKVLREIGDSYRPIKSFVHTAGVGESTPI